MGEVATAPDAVRALPAIRPQVSRDEWIMRGAMGVIGLVGAAMLWRWLPRYVPRQPRHPETEGAERDEGWTPAADT